MTKILNIDTIAERIKKAVQENERIILYGDSDMDGISSVVLLETAIMQMGGKVDIVVFPNRENDGYGVNLRALEFLKEKAPALFITLDLGIGNVKEIDEANKLGFEVIVVDHHQPLAQIPNASLIMDPFQKGDEYAFKGFANVGLTYKLALELLGDSITDKVKNNLAELAALGTIADMVPQLDENKDIIKRGLDSLPKSKRMGFKVFFDIIKGRNVNYAAQIISALNCAESEHFQNRAYVLLTSKDEDECSRLAQELLDKSAYKQEQIKTITEEVERRIAKKDDESIIFEGDPAWRLVLAGSVASGLVRKYEKPIFIFKKMDDESCGSVRSIKGVDSVEMMKSCADLLITYGGHPMASGFRVKNENLDEFKKRLIEYLKK